MFSIKNVSRITLRLLSLEPDQNQDSESESKALARIEPGVACRWYQILIYTAPLLRSA
jgi:hypothetical protein